MASTFSLDSTGIAAPQMNARHGGRYVAVRKTQAASAGEAPASRDIAPFIPLIGGSALMAFGAVVLATLVGAMLFIRHPVDVLALAGAHFFSADELIRSDMLQDLAFEAAFAWTLAFLAILFWRCRAPQRPFNNTAEGGDHGN